MRTRRNLEPPVALSLFRVFVIQEKHERTKGRKHEKDSCRTTRLTKRVGAACRAFVVSCFRDSRETGEVYDEPQVATKPIEAANITAAVVQPSTLRPTPLTRLPMIWRLLAMSRMTTKRGGAMKPLMTDTQKSARTGLIPTKLRSSPTAVETPITT